MLTRWLAVAALGSSLIFTTNLMADKDKSKHKGNPHSEQFDDDQGWERRDGYDYRVYGAKDERPPGWGHGKKTGWGNCGMPPDRLRSMDAEPTFTRVARTTTIKTIKGGFLCDVLQWRFTEASTSSARPFVTGASDNAAG